jgi:hypothetical protein
VPSAAGGSGGQAGASDEGRAALPVALAGVALLVGGLVARRRARSAADHLGPPLRMVTSDGAASAERRVYGAGGLTIGPGSACPAVVPLTGHDSGAPVGGLRPGAEAVASAPGPAAVANEADADVTVTSGRAGAPSARRGDGSPRCPPGRRRPAPDLPDVPRPRRHRTGGAGGCPARR